MAGVPVLLEGVLWDEANKRGYKVAISGDLSRTDRQIGGGPILPDEKPPGGGDGKPPGIWGGPIDPYPGHPLPEPPGGGVPPEGPPDQDGFIKPPPPEGGWAYHQRYAWMYDPPAGAAGPK